MLSWNEILEFFANHLANRMGLFSMDNCGQWRSVFAVDADVQANQVICPESDLLEGHGGITLRATLQLIEVICDHFCERELR